MDWPEGEERRRGLISLARQLGAELSQRGWLLATAESCTGGMLAGYITEMPGCSAWFDCGWVTYSNASKTRLLGVAAPLIDSHGAVSEAVVCAMAMGVLQRSAAQIAVAISGVAGPGGGSAEKPVGTVCLGWAWAERVESVTHHYQGDRQNVRDQALHGALSGLIERVRRPVGV